MIDLIAHLEAQLASADRLFANVTAQTEAIKTQDVSTLLARLGDVQTELVIRRRIETDREQLIQAAATRRNVAPETIDLDAILDGMPADVTEHGRTLSAQLRATLANVQRVHTSNRVLIRQELTFVSYLLQVLSGAPQAGYSSGGWAASARPVASVDARV